MSALPSDLRPATASSCLALVAREAESPWEARGLTDLVPPATLAEARTRRDELTALLGRERAAAADFLLALADFDRRRGWERLGHASLFAFLTRELGLSSGAAQLRLSAARLLPRHLAVEAALRSGRLCISAVGQLARVLTPENEGAVLPRFFGRSAREAAELAAALLPRAEPPMRTLVTPLPAPRLAPRPAPLPAALLVPLPGALLLPASMDRPSGPPAPARDHSTSAPPRLVPPQAPLHTCEVPAPDQVSAPHQEPPRRPEVEPLTAALRRLHLTVSKGFLEKLAAARTGSNWQVELDHVVPLALGGPTTAANLRCACAFHNRYAAEQALGPAVAGARRRTDPNAGRAARDQGGGGACHGPLGGQAMRASPPQGASSTRWPSSSKRT